ncbi:MAG: hypothetical protein PVJ01_07105 [Pseudomonadota bacterium]|jgi:hypothetical protein
MEQVKVVARLMDGRIIKGFTNDFFPKKPTFHVGSDPSDKGIEIAITDLKALFFVKDFEGNPNRTRKQDFEDGKVYQGRKAEVTFVDGEKMAGTVLGYDKERPGFFMVPVDEVEGNNTRAFIGSAAVKEMEFL